MYIDAYDRDMKMEIWLILPYDIAWDKAHSMDKDPSYPWYMRVLLSIYLNILYTSIYQVYDSIYQV